MSFYKWAKCTKEFFRSGQKYPQMIYLSEAKNVGLGRICRMLWPTLLTCSGRASVTATYVRFKHRLTKTFVNVNFACRVKRTKM